MCIAISIIIVAKILEKLSVSRPKKEALNKIKIAQKLIVVELTSVGDFDLNKFIFRIRART